MSRESQHTAVNMFKEIKADAGCDDVAAAILTLAQSLGSIEVWLKMESDTAYDLKHAGSEVAEAIQNVTRDGAIRLAVGGESPLTTKKPKKK